jgi:hypothetical protein
MLFLPGGLESLGPRLKHLFGRKRKAAQPAVDQAAAVKARGYEPS